MSDWEDSKQEFIDKLSNADKTFDEIFNKDNEALVIQGDERIKLQELQAANKKILHKLKSREFTVAVVGLEKAGKSTLGNALIKSMVLPEYSERCTYTTTEIRSGSSDEAEIYFYSREEFNKNFKRMLNEIKYPDAIDFSAMTLDTFQRYWRAVEVDPELRGLFMLHNGTTAEDIRAMLEGKRILLPLLGHAPMKFGPEYWSGSDEFNEFKTYITGMSGKNLDGSVIRQPHPYAVKNVIIRSTQLADMSHLVLYDVPGFDSPTELHKRQTEEMLKESDAIILVTNVGDRPNLTGTQLDMLRKGQDQDGIKLSAKAFVFGNKIDRASDVTTAKNNLAALKNESVSKYQIALGNHIVGGSARAYLEKKGLIAGNVASEMIDKWQLPDDDGVKVLLDKMQEYYDNDRFEVLRKRAETTLNNTKTVLQTLLDRYSTGELNYNDGSIDIYMNIRENLPAFNEHAKQIIRTHMKNIASDKPFSTVLRDNINTIYQTVAEGHLPLLKTIEDTLHIDQDYVYPTTTVNGMLRDNLKGEFKQNIVNEASKLTQERHQIIKDELNAAFLDAMGMEKSTSYKVELEESVNKIFAEIFGNKLKELNFNPMVERFAATLIETLMEPFAEQERLDKVLATTRELVSLSVYYNMPEDSSQISLDDLGKDGLNFFAKILLHEGVEEGEVDAAENESILQEIFNDNKDQITRGTDLSIDKMPFADWAKTLKKSGIDLKSIKEDQTIKKRDKLANKLEELFYKDDWINFSSKQRIEQIERTIKAYRSVLRQTQNNDDDVSLLGQLETFHRNAQAVKRMKTKDEMIETLDVDINILRDLTSRSVITAIDLERAFNAVMNDNTNIILYNLKQPEIIKKIINPWIRSNAPKLMPSQFEKILEEGAIAENRKAIVKAIRESLNKLDD